MNTTITASGDMNAIFIRNDIPPAILYICDVIMVIIILTGIIGNVLICVCIYKNRTLRTYMNANIVSSSVSNILGCVFLVPIRIYLYNYNENRYSNCVTLCSMAVFFRTLCDTMQLFMLGVVSYERYYSVAHPFKKQGRFCRTVFLILSSWILSVGLSLLSVFIFIDSALYDRCFPYEHSYKSQWGKHDLYLLFPLGVTTLILIFCFYGLILYTLVQHSTTMANHFKVKKNKITPLEVEPKNGNDISSSKRNDKYLGQTSKSQENASKLVNKLNDDNQSSNQDVLSTKIDKMYTYRANVAANDASNAQLDVIYEHIPQEMASRTLPKMDEICSARSDVSDVQIKNNLHSEVMEVKNISIRDLSHTKDIEKNVHSLNGIFKNESRRVKGNMDVSQKSLTSFEKPSIVFKDKDQTMEVNCPHDEIEMTENKSVSTPKCVTIPTTDDINENMNSEATKSDGNIISKSNEEVTCKLPQKDQRDFISLKVPEIRDVKSPLKSEIRIYDIDGNIESVTKNENNFAGSVCLMNSKNREKGRRKVEVRAAKKIAILIGAFICCWLPLPSLVIGTMNMLPLSLVQHQVLVVCGTIATASIAVNPLLYALLNKPINTAMKTMYFQNTLFKTK